MPLNLTAAQRTAKIKEIISAKLNLDEPLYEVSQEEWVYDRDAQGSWVVNEESVGIIDPETQETIIALDRRVGSVPYLLSQIPFSEDLIPEAFQDSNDMCCVPRQLSALLNIDFGLICNEMSEVERNLYGESKWCEKGTTPSSNFVSYATLVYVSCTMAPCLNHSLGQTLSLLLCTKIICTSIRP